VTAELRREAVKNLPQPAYNIMTTETVIAQGSAVLEECFEENCVIALGSKIGADYIVRGTISKLQTRFTLSVEMYETENGNLVASSEAVRSENIGELVEKAAVASADMFRAFASAQPPAPQKPPETYAVTVTVNPANGGYVHQNPSKAVYNAGDSLTMTAVPYDGYEFTGWSGASKSTDATLTGIIKSNVELTANFQPVQQKTYTLTTNVSPPEGGYITRNPDKETYPTGETVIVTATPESGYVFKGWTGTATGKRRNRATTAMVATVTTVTTVATVTMNGNKTLTANFQPKPQPRPQPTKSTIPRTYTLKTTVSPQGGGHITRNPDKETYTTGEMVILTATPESGYTFTGWTGAVTSRRSGRNSVTVTMGGNRALTANFYKKLKLNQTPFTPAGKVGRVAADRAVRTANPQPALRRATPKPAPRMAKPQPALRKAKPAPAPAPTAAWLETTVKEIVKDMSAVGGIFYAGDLGGGLRWGNGEVLAMPCHAGGAYLSLDAVYAALSIGYAQGGGKWENTHPNDLPYMRHSSFYIGVSAKYPDLIEAVIYIADSKLRVSACPMLGLDYDLPTFGKLEFAGKPEYAFDGSYNGYGTDALSALWVKFGGGIDVYLTPKIYLRAEALYGARMSNWLELDLMDRYQADMPKLGHGLTLKAGAGFKR
jgi:uncharacterized repeat protein (TIGR02543 family)